MEFSKGHGDSAGFGVICGTGDLVAGVGCLPNADGKDRQRHSIYLGGLSIGIFFTFRRYSGYMVSAPPRVGS
jgi:hypothetical protein